MEIRVKFDATLWLVSAICSIITVAAMLMAYPTLWPWIGDNSSNIASWVQAIGSIAAIFGASWSAMRAIRYEHSQAERAQRAEAAILGVPLALDLKGVAETLRDIKK